MSFSWLEWSLQLLLIVLLGLAIPFAIRLERALREVRKDRAALEASTKGISEVAAAAESAMVRMRATAELAARQVQERVTTAEPLRDDLRFLIERAETLADRLESVVRAGRPMTSYEAPARPPARPPPAPARSDGPALRSQAERDLLRALSVGLGRVSR
ncbi:MAG: hypothetical protein ING09_14520 [Roseomonas sp.]|jgi:hypothetical protein|nr:hypothetical protein [Roseomonas sp.]MCA3275100.1 hypothetical protein [Roseomonas sp.]MCA3283551.1 hypothetical protein [Roseomonas sp.]MCA3287758.1 hypothetical protein [Roseomonas sp.]MCA3290681.1 hypothetical protein [Roseomonas sp.]